MYNNKLLTINNNFFLFLFLIASYNINTDVSGNSPYSSNRIKFFG